MMYKEKLFNYYIKSITYEKFEVTDDVLSSEHYRNFKDKYRHLLKEGSLEDYSTFKEPQHLPGEIYTLIKKVNDDSSRVIEYMYSNIAILGYNLVYKVSPFIELAHRVHIPVRTDTLNAEYIVQTDNSFFLTNDDLNSSLYEGAVKNMNLIKRYLKGEAIEFPLKNKKLDKYDHKFAENEKMLVSEFKNPLVKSFENASHGKVVDLTYLMSQDEDIDNRSAIREPSILSMLPNVASSAFINRKALKSLQSITGFGDYPLAKEEYADNFTLKMNDKGLVIIEIDPKYYGRHGILVINNYPVFKGYLPSIFKLGVLRKETNLRSLISVIKLLS